MTTAEVALIVRYHAMAGKGDEVAALLAQHTAATRAEPGCRDFMALRVTEDPDSFVLYERYESHEAFEAHLASPHYEGNRRSQDSAVAQRPRRRVLPGHHPQVTPFDPDGAGQVGKNRAPNRQIRGWQQAQVVAVAAIAVGALAATGVFSTVAFAVVAATGGLITGNPAAAAVSLAASFLLAAAVAAIVVAMRFPRARTWLVGHVTAALRLSRHVIKRPKGEPRSVVTGALDRVGTLHLGYRTAAGAFGWTLVNWIEDVACLVCAIKAVGEPVPWAAILIIWTAGIGAASFSPGSTSWLTCSNTGPTRIGSPACRVASISMSHAK